MSLEIQPLLVMRSKNMHESFTETKKGGGGERKQDREKNNIYTYELRETSEQI